MKLVWHIVRKDFRHLRFYLVGWIGLVISMRFLTGIDLYLTGPINLLLWFGGGLQKLIKVFALSLIVSRLVHADSPVGNTAFWLSRPVSRPILLFGKSLFLVVFLILPTLLVESLFLLVNGVTVFDIFRSVPQILFWQLLYISILMMLAAVTRSLSRMVVLGVVVFIAIPWVSVFLRVALSFLGYRFEMAPALTYSTSKWIAFGLGLVSIAGIVVRQQYITRRTAISGILLVGGVVVSCAMPWLWTWDFVGRLQEPRQDVLDSRQVQAMIDEQSLTFNRDGSGTRRIDGRMILQGKFVLGNIPSNLFVIPERVVSTPLHRKGRKPYRDEHRNPYVPIEVPRPSTSPTPPLHQERLESLESALGGARFLDTENTVHARYLPDLLSVSVDNYKRHEGRGADFIIDVDFLLQQDEIVTIQLEKGARYDGGSDHAKILDVKVGNRSVRIELEESRHRLVHDHIKSRRYVLHNQSRREALLGVEFDDPFRTLSIDSFLPPMAYFPVMLKVARTTLSFELPSDSVPDQQDWFQDAELVRFGTDTLGRFSKSVRLDGVVIREIPRS